MIARLLELFEGPEAPGPWSPPAMPAALHALLPWRAFDEASELYVNAAGTGLLCNREGCPVAVEVFDGNTADPNTVGVAHREAAPALRPLACGARRRPRDAHRGAHP